MSKKELLYYALGEKPPPPKLLILLERDHTGEVNVIEATLLEGAPIDIVFLSCRNGGTDEFWKAHDCKNLIEAVRKYLVNRK